MFPQKLSESPNVFALSAVLFGSTSRAEFALHTALGGEAEPELVEVCCPFVALPASAVATTVTTLLPASLAPVVVEGVAAASGWVGSTSVWLGTVAVIEHPQIAPVTIVLRRTETKPSRDEIACMQTGGARRVPL